MLALEDCQICTTMVGATSLACACTAVNKAAAAVLTVVSVWSMASTASYEVTAMPSNNMSALRHGLQQIHL